MKFHLFHFWSEFLSIPLISAYDYFVVIFFKLQIWQLYSTYEYIRILIFMMNYLQLNWHFCLDSLPDHSGFLNYRALFLPFHQIHKSSLTYCMQVPFHTFLFYRFLNSFRLDKDRKNFHFPFVEFSFVVVCPLDRIVWTTHDVRLVFQFCNIKFVNYAIDLIYVYLDST